MRCAFSPIVPLKYLNSINRPSFYCCTLFSISLAHLSSQFCAIYSCVIIFFNFNSTEPRMRMGNYHFHNIWNQEIWTYFNVETSFIIGTEEDLEYEQTCDVQHTELSLRVRSKIWQYITCSAHHHVMFNATVNDRTTRYFATIPRRFSQNCEKLLFI